MSGITIKTSATFNSDIELKASSTIIGQNDKKKAEITYIDGVSSTSGFNYTYGNLETRLIMSVNNQNENPGAIQLLNINPENNTVQYSLAPVRSNSNIKNNRLCNYKLGLAYKQKDNNNDNEYSYRWDRVFVNHPENVQSDTLLKTNKLKLGTDIPFDDIRPLYENVDVYRADVKVDVNDTNTETELTIIAQELGTAINSTSNTNLDFLIEESSDEQIFDSSLGTNGEHRNLQTLCPNNINYMNMYMIKTLLDDPIINGSFTLRDNSTNKTQLLNINSNGAFEYGADNTGYGTAGQILQSQGDSASPIWSTITAQNNAYMLRVSTADNIAFDAGDLVDLTVAGVLSTGWEKDFEEHLPSGETGFANDTLTIPRTGHYQFNIKISLTTTSNSFDLHYGELQLTYSNNTIIASDRFRLRENTSDTDDVAELSLSINTIEELVKNDVLKLRVMVATNDSASDTGRLRAFRHTNIWSVIEVPTALFAEPTNTALTSAANNDILQYNSQTGLWNNTSSLTLSGNINCTSSTFTNFNITGSGATKSGSSTIYSATITSQVDNLGNPYIDIDKINKLTGNSRTGILLQNDSLGSGSIYHTEVKLKYDLDISIEHILGPIQNYGNINLTASNGDINLAASGDVKLSNGGLVTSDDRIKHNEVNIVNGLDIVRQIVPQKYHKTKEMYEENYTGNNYRIESGFIAQDILKIPDLTYCVSGGDYIDENNNNVKSKYYLAYQDIFVYGIAATKELDAIVKNQQTTINELNTKISNQEDENISLKEDNTLLKEENTLIKSKLNEILTEMGKETI